MPRPAATSCFFKIYILYQLSRSTVL